MRQKFRRLLTIHYSLFTKNKGFTLIELAIVLIIIGILVALGVGLIGPLTKQAKYTETKEIVNADVESVISHGASNRLLPVQGDFVSDGTNDEFVEIVRTPQDSWTKTLYYIVDPNLTTFPTGSTEAICNRRTTDLTVCRDALCTVATNISNVAFVVISGADNYNVQTGILTAAPCPTATCVIAYDVDTPNIDDCTGAANCPNYPAAETINRPEPYDDIVKWVTLNELRIKTGCVGAQLNILNNELAPGYRCNAYSATITADGGVPYAAGGAYRWCTQGTLPGGLTLTPNTVSADCLSLAEASWGQADDLTLSAIAGALYQYGTYSLTFFARDDNDAAGTDDNVAQKTLVLTISDLGTNIRVWNTTGATYDFRIDGVCDASIGNNSEITGTYFFNPGEVIDRHTTAGGPCSSAIQQTITYDQAVAVDTDCDFQVNYTLAGPTDR
ncbi:MAG: prepilin-type N-terminal cleavage/methylation domain-containing protein [Nitrospirota bacterium]